MNTKLITKTVGLAAALILSAGCGDDDTNQVDRDGGANPDGGGDFPAMPAVGDQIDRTGRPAITTALVGTFGADADAKGELKDNYNAALPSAWASFAADIQASLGILDALDAVCGNQLLATVPFDADDADRYAGLAGVLADDQLYVNSDSGSCGQYLAVEADATAILPNDDCGGRTPSYDVVDASYSVLAVGSLSGAGDTIPANDCVDEATFPFLCEAN